jgi:predicted amidophosphoribosyltransferase
MPSAGPVARSWAPIGWSAAARHRRRNVAGAFAVKPGRDVMGKRILQVDDVLTTGAASAECARLFLEVGAARVEILTLARTVRPE